MMRTKLFFFVVLAAMIMFAASGFAADIADDFIVKAGAKLITKTNMESLTEVVFEMPDGKKHVMYETQDGNYIIFGALVNNNGRNLTKEKIDILNKVDFTKIPLTDAITIKKGDGSKELVMVSDVDCPYCKKSFEYLMGKNNYTLYVFLNPIEQLHPASKGKSVRILCSKDPVGALAAVEEGKDIPAKSCAAGEAALAKDVLIAHVLGATGTPAFVLSDGRRLDGFMKKDLDSYLSGGASK